MTRRVPEWIAKSDDAAIPPRVKARVCLDQDGRCAVCGAKFGVKVRPEFDHRIAIINGGKHRETNLQALCGICHGAKTRRDVAQKSKDARVRQQHMGIPKKVKRKLPGGKDSPWKIKVGGGAVPRE